VEALTELGPAVLFSAAIPLQEGVHHLNEQWPEYWANLFLRRNYFALDVMRPRIWFDAEVQWWYRQNTVLFCDRSMASAIRTRLDIASGSCPNLLPLVHPELWKWRNEEMTRPATLAELPGLVAGALSRSIARRFRRSEPTRRPLESGDAHRPRASLLDGHGRAPGQE
jgi:hypothetical protein